MKIPIFDIVFDDETGGVNAVSLVTDPAIQSTWMAFSEEPIAFKMQSDEKRILLGAMLIPDKLILRKDKDGNPFFVRFSRDVIERTVDKYFQTQKTNNTNAQHDKAAILDGVYMIGSFIKDSSIGMLPPENMNDHPDGTWFGFFKVNNDVVWNQYVKTGIFTGFSIEGLYGLSDSGQSTDISMSNEDIDVELFIDELYKMIAN